MGDDPLRAAASLHERSTLIVTHVPEALSAIRRDLAQALATLR